MSETPKRLVPKKEIVRELYLKSGNECAFGGCSERLIDKDGVLVGELCHIEAALPDGQRFNPSQTNEERCSFENLLLLCSKHHTVTNDVNVYTVERLKRIKSEHETKYTDIVRRIQNSMTDFTELWKPKLPTKLRRFYQVNGWDPPEGEEQLREVVADIEKLAGRLRPVPKSALTFLAILIERGQMQSLGFNDSIRALHHDIVEACETDDETVVKYVRILERHNLVSVEDDDGAAEIVVKSILDWPFWGPLKIFCKETGVYLKEIIVEGRFDLLD